MQIEHIKNTINKWDPINLLDFAPADEYDEECRKILMNYSTNSSELGMKIFSIFSEHFEDAFMDNETKCIAIAKEIIQLEQSRTGKTDNQGTVP